MYKVKHNLCARTVCNMFYTKKTHTLIVYGREIFIYLDFTMLRKENVQFDI